MRNELHKTLWRRIGIIVILIPCSFFFPLIWVVVAGLIWTIVQDLREPAIASVPPPASWREAKADESDWLALFSTGCESPAEVAFLQAMVGAFGLVPDNGKLRSPALTLEMQVVSGQYRFDFLANGRQVIEIDGAAWHSSPEQQERDRIRDEYSIAQGYRVLRIPAKTVFNTPDQAIEQVKKALEETPEYLKPVRQKQDVPAQRLSFTGIIEEINRTVTMAHTQQQVLAEIKSAVDTEQIYLEALIAEVEHDVQVEQRLQSMTAQERELYEINRARLAALLEGNSASTPAGAEIYGWKAIVQPEPVKDAEIQQHIERELQEILAQRQRRLAQLAQRCREDAEFAQRFRRKLDDARYPSTALIFSAETPFSSAR